MNSLSIRKLAWFALCIFSVLAFAAHAPLAHGASRKARSPTRLAPLPPEKEWWLTGTGDDGRQLPVLTNPWWERSGDAMRDRATGVSWRGIGSLPNSTPEPFERAQSACEKSGMRLPTRHEMESIIEPYRAAPVIDPATFPGLVTDFYWTLTPASPRAIWLVHLDDGRFVKSDIRSSRVARFFCVRDLRGSPPSSHYDVSAGVIRDNGTGLHWQTALTSADDFQSLASACAAARVSGMRWRVPTIKELLSILSPERAAPYIDPVFRDDRQLASSTSADTKGGVRFQGISFATGERVAMEGTITRCVSNGEAPSGSGDRIAKGNVEILGGSAGGTPVLQAFEATQVRGIEGNVLVQGVTSAALVLPYLETIKGDLIITTTRLGEIHLPNLAEVTGTITIERNAALQKLSMRSLVSVGKDAVVSDNAVLGSQQAADDTGTDGGALSADRLHSVGGAVKIDSNRQLKTFVWPALQSVGHEFFMTMNESLWWAQAPRLASIGSKCTSTSDSCGALDVSFNEKLRTLNVHALEKVFGDFRLRDNAALDDTPNSLTDIGLGLFVEGNKSFCARDKIDPFLYRMWAKGRFPGVISITRNDPAERCRTACPNRQGTNCSIER